MLQLRSERGGLGIVDTFRDPIFGEVEALAKLLPLTASLTGPSLVWGNG